MLLLQYLMHLLCIIIWYHEDFTFVSYNPLRSLFYRLQILGFLIVFYKQNTETCIKYLAERN